MTHLLTRLYANEKIVEIARNRLWRAGFPKNATRVIAKRDGEDTAALMKRIQGAHVPERAAGVYAESVAAGNMLLLVTADYKPLSARKIGRTILDELDPVPSNLEDQEFKLGWVKDHAPSVMKDCPRFLTGENETTSAYFSEQFGFGTVSKKPRRIKVSSGGPILPFPALTTGRKAKSAMSGGGHMSRLFWPMKLISTGARRNSVIEGGARPLSRLLG